MIINHLCMILNIVILHMNYKNRLNSTSCHGTFFFLEPILKYIHIRFCLGLALVNLSLISINLVFA